MQLIACVLAVLFMLVSWMNHRALPVSEARSGLKEHLGIYHCFFPKTQCPLYPAAQGQQTLHQPFAAGVAAAVKPMPGCLWSCAG